MSEGVKLIRVSEVDFLHVLDEVIQLRRQVNELQARGTEMALERQHMRDMNRLAKLADAIAHKLDDDHMLDASRAAFKLLVEWFKEPVTK
jgi:hypothetical protein